MFTLSIQQKAQRRVIFSVLHVTASGTNALAAWPWGPFAANTSDTGTRSVGMC